MGSLLTRLAGRVDFGFLTALVIPILAIAPLLTHTGLPNTADGPAHLMRQVELNQAWQQGLLYLRWGTDLALGHGMPIFNYTPPLLYQLTQLFHLTGLALDESMKAVIAIDFLLYSLGMFLFVRRVFGPFPALLAAAVHVYAPYRLRESYIQGSYGQFSALALYPLVLWAFHGLITDGRPRYLGAAALSLAALLLSHNISALHFAPLLVVYLIFLLLLAAYNAPNRQHEVPGENIPDTRLPESRGPGRARDVTSPLLSPLLRVAIAGLLGLGLAAIYWLPAFGERHYVQFEKITQGFFDFRHNFLSLAELVALPLPLDLAAINPEFPFSLGPAQLVSALAGLIVLIAWTANAVRRPDRGRFRQLADPVVAHTAFFALACLISVFLTQASSTQIWEVVPLLDLTEFPWRLLGPAVFCASVLAATTLTGLHELFSISTEKVALPVLNGLLVVVIALNAFYLYPSQFIPWGTPGPADAFSYEVTTGAIGTNSAAEMLPRWVTQPPGPNALWPDYAAGRPPAKIDPSTLPRGATVETSRHLAESNTLTIETPEPFMATLRTLYWPGWQVYLNGERLPIRVTRASGLIQVSIPAGRHTLNARLESTLLRTAGLWFTVLAGAALAVLILAAVVSKRCGVDGGRVTPYGRTTGVPTLAGSRSIGAYRSVRLTWRSFAVTLAVLLAVYLLSRPLAPWLTLQSDPDRPQQADRKLQVDFSDQLRLVGADNLPQTITQPASGEASLNAVLYWRALQELDRNYAVFLHLDAPDGQTVATVDQVNPDNIPTGSWPPGLYLRNPMQLRIPTNLPPIRYQVTAGVYDRSSSKRLPINGSEANVFSLGSVWLTTSPPASIPPVLAKFGPQITLHGAMLAGETLTLLWQTGEPLAQDYAIFVHVVDGRGELLSQSDGVPYDGLYPPAAWQPGQLVEDRRMLDLAGQPYRVAIGVYDPVTGHRLPALDASGERLANDSFAVTVTMRWQVRNLVVLSVYTVLVLVMTYPLALRLSATVPNDIGDPLLNTWILAWNTHAVLTDPVRLFSANIFSPLPNTLAYSEHLFSTAMLALPLQLVAGEPILVYNASLLITFPIAGFGMYLLVLHWTRHRGAAFVAGLIFAFTPYRFAAIAHLQLLTFQWLPYTILFLDLMIGGGRRAGHRDSPGQLRYFIALVTMLTLQILASWYLAVYSGLILALYLGAAGLARRFGRRTFIEVGLALVVAAMLTIPFLLPYIPLVSDIGKARPLVQALSVAALAADYAAATPFNRVFGPLTEFLRTRPGFTEENTLFTGVTAPILAVLATTAVILRWVQPLDQKRQAISDVTAAGNGRDHRSSVRLVPLSSLLTLTIAIALTFALPYTVVAYLVPASTIIRVPPRWVIPALFALASLAGLGYATLDRRVANLWGGSSPARSGRLVTKALLVIVACLLLAESFSAPIPLAVVENRSQLGSAYLWLAQQDQDFTLIELPFHSAPAPEFPEVKRLYASTLGWWPLVNGYSGYTPPRQSDLAREIASFPDEPAISALQDLAKDLPARQAKLYLLIHPGEAPLDRSRWETIDRWSAERNPAVVPIGQFDGDFLYQIRPLKPTWLSDQPLATFGPDQAIQLLASDTQHLTTELAPQLAGTAQPLSTTLTLYWQTTGKPADDYTVFVHLRAADGFIRGQADSPPVSDHYRTSLWQLHETIQDIHTLPDIDLGQVDHIAVGLYDPASGERLPAFSPTGQRLPDDALIITTP